MSESPAAAAVREAREEISADVQLIRLVNVLGGPDYEVSYPNGDRTAHVTAVYEARIINGSPAPSDDELSELAWFTPAQLPGDAGGHPVRQRRRPQPDVDHGTVRHRGTDRPAQTRPLLCDWGRDACAVLPAGPGKSAFGTRP